MPEISTASELELKTIGCMSKLVTRFENGLITKDQLSIALDSVWDCVSGLTPPGSGVPDTLSSLMSEAQVDVSIYRRHFYNSTQILTFSWKVGYSSYSVIMRDCGQAVSRKTYNAASPEDARTRMENTMAELTKKGWGVL